MVSKLCYFASFSCIVYNYSLTVTIISYKYQELSMEEEICEKSQYSSTHNERKITNLSGKHSFTLYPSVSPYSQTDGLAKVCFS